MWPAGVFWYRSNNSFWLSLIIYNTPNGVSKVEQNVDGTCVPPSSCLLIAALARVATSAWPVKCVGCLASSMQCPHDIMSRFSTCLVSAFDATPSWQLRLGPTGKMPCTGTCAEVCTCRLAARACKSAVHTLLSRMCDCTRSVQSCMHQSDICDKACSFTMQVADTQQEWTWPAI